MRAPIPALLGAAVALAGCRCPSRAGDTSAIPDPGGRDAGRDEADRTRTKAPSPVRNVVVGNVAMCARLEDDRVFCWGHDAGGFVGDGSPIADRPEDRVRSRPVQVQGLTPPLSSIGPGWAITTAGVVEPWATVLWVLDSTTMVERRTRAAPWTAPPPGVLQYVGGENFGCVRTRDGAVSCGGAGSVGTLGDGGRTGRPTFGAVSLGPTVSIGAQAERACAVLATGKVLCWGRDYSVPRETPSAGCGPSPTGPGPAGAVPFSMASGPCDPTTHVDALPVPVKGLSEAVEVTVGYQFACARRSDGSVWCWGVGTDAQLGDGTRDSRPSAAPVSGLRGKVAQVAAGNRGACVRYESGGLDCWGNVFYDLYPTAHAMPAIDDAIDLSVGSDAACVVRRRDGNVWCFGTLDKESFEVPPAGAYATPAPLRWSK